MSILCGSRDQLAATFAELDRDEREKKLNMLQPEAQEDDIDADLRLSSASLSPADRRVIRTEVMDLRIAAAAGSRRHDAAAEQSALHPTVS